MKKGLSNYLKEIENNKESYLFLLPMYLLLLVFLIVPAFQGLYMGFYKYNAHFEKSFVGVKNFLNILQDNIFWIAMKNTIILFLVVVPLSLIISLLISVIVYNKSQWLKAFIRGAFYLPIVVSGVTLTLTWAYIYNPVFGLANYLLSLLNLGPVVWLGDPRFALLSIIIIIFTFSLGSPIVLYLASLGSIPKSYYEAAEIDGASKVGQFFHITLPLLKPTTLFLLITGTIGAFQVFVVIQLLTSGGPNNATQTLLYLLYQRAFVYGKYGNAAVIGTFLLIFTSIIAILQYKFLVSDIEY